MFVKKRITFVELIGYYSVSGEYRWSVQRCVESRNPVVLLFRGSVSSVSPIRNRAELDRFLSILFDRSPSRASNFQSSQNSAILSKRLRARAGGDQLQRKRRRGKDARVQRRVESLPWTTRLTKTRMVDGKIQTLRGRVAEFHSGSLCESIVVTTTRRSIKTKHADRRFVRRIYPMHSVSVSNLVYATTLPPISSISADLFIRAACGTHPRNWKKVDNSRTKQTKVRPKV